MRIIEGRRYYTIGEMASAIGVSRQTLRVWEARRLLSPARSPGGQRPYTRADLFAANRLELVRGRRGWDPTRARTPSTLQPAREARESLSLGMRIRAARRARKLSLESAAARIGISRSFLGSIERGEANASANAMSRIADALNMPQSAFSAPREPSDVHIVRAHERPRTQLDQGVRWEELSAPGELLEPALLVVPPGATSGGTYVRPGTSFAYMVSGCLSFWFGSATTEIALNEGDSVTFPGQMPVSWRNTGLVDSRAVWVEQLHPEAWAGEAGNGGEGGGSPPDPAT